MIPRPPTSTLFPYTTLFRSKEATPPAVATAARVPRPIRVRRRRRGLWRPALVSAVTTGSAPGLALSTADSASVTRSEEHTSELQSHSDLVCRLLLEKKKKQR